MSLTTGTSKLEMLQKEEESSGIPRVERLMNDSIKHDIKSNLWFKMTIKFD